MSLTKAQLAAMLPDHLGLNRREAKDMVQSFYKEICLALESGEPVKLTGFGNFEKDTFTPSAKLKALTRDSR